MPCSKYENLVKLTEKEMKNTNGGSLIGFIIGFVGACAVYAAQHEKEIHLPGGQAMKQ
jgi:hypothetical protein